MLFNEEQWPVYAFDRGSDQPGSPLEKAMDAMASIPVHDNWRESDEPAALVNATIANALMLRDLIHSLYLLAEVIDNKNNNERISK